MTASVSDLASILRGAGLTVNTSYAQPGESGTFTPIGLIYHHDAAGLSYVDNWGGRDNTTIAQSMAPQGSNGAQFWVGRSGTWYILSSGMKWHAGSGGPWGKIPANQGNRYTYGIETDYGPVRSGWSGGRVTSAGYTWPTWDTAHRQAIDAGSAALAKALGLTQFCAHKEYAPSRKIDPANVDLNAWRKAIASGGTVDPPKPPDPEDELTPEQLQQIVDQTSDAVMSKLLAQVWQWRDASQAALGKPPDRSQRTADFLATMANYNSVTVRNTQAS